MDPRDTEAAYEDEVTGRTTLPRMFAAAVERHADREAQGYKGGVYDRSLAPDVLSPAPDGEFATLTYADFGDIVQTLSAGFRDLGVGPGDRVAIAADTRLEWAACDFAVLAAAGVVTTVYPRSSPRRVRYLLDDAGATAVVAENPALVDRVRSVEDDLDRALDFVVSMDALSAPDRDDALDLAEVHARGAEAFDEAARERRLAARDPDDLASLIYTSGTTARPKGVPLTHWNLKANVDQCRKRFGPRPDRENAPIDETTRMVSYLPLAHVFERLAGHFLPFASGTLVAYAESPDTLRADFAAVRPTAATSVPRVYEQIFRTIRARASESAVRERAFRWATGVGRAFATTDEPGLALRAKRRLADRLVFSRVRAALGGEIDFLISGGGSLSPDLNALYHGMGLPILEGYGLTETSPVVAANTPEAPRIGSIGLPVVDLDVRLDADAVDPGTFDDVGDDSEGEDEVEGEVDVGELLVRGPNVVEGYWHRPDATAAAFSAGWFHTGDIVAREPDGYLRFLGRAKELLVLSTGKNVAPGPIEDAFAASPIVDACLAVGDDRPFVAALIVPDFEAVRDWAGRRGIDLPATKEGICRDDRVRDRIADEVDRVNAGLERHEAVEAFRLVPEAFTRENDLLTPTLKKKRRTILSYYDEAVAELYVSDDGA